jgi:hypothetical protein
MSDARALVAALARVSARWKPRPYHKFVISPAGLALAALAALAVGASASAMPDEPAMPALELPAPPPEPPKTPESFAVRIGDEGDATFCTGFFVGGKNVAFAGHCVTTMLTGERVLRSSFKVTLDTDETLTADLVAFSDPVPGGQDWALARLRGAVPGFVNGATRAVGPWRHPVVPMTLAVAPGASGSAVQLADSGKVVGIAVGMNGVQPAYSYAQPIAPICWALGR